MSKYEIVNIGGGEDGDYSESVSFDSVSEVDEETLYGFLGGFCLLVNCSCVADEDLDHVEWQNVKEILNEMNDSWYEGEGKEEFIEKYGEMEGLRWGIEYDDNCSVLLSGDWLELRKEVMSEFKRLDPDIDDY